MISVTVDRATLALPNLVIGVDASTGIWLPEDALTEPGRVWRRTRASSPWMDRSVQTRATLEDGDVRLTVYVQGATTAARKTKQAEVNAAFGQFVYDLTVTEDGQATVYKVGCADVTWNDFDSGMTRAFIARATIVAPLDA